jgi:hypothetical protein
MTVAIHAEAAGTMKSKCSDSHTSSAPTLTERRYNASLSHL